MKGLYCWDCTITHTLLHQWLFLPCHQVELLLTSLQSGMPKVANNMHVGTCRSS